MVYVRAYFPKLNGLYLQGSGALIGAETVLTAGHVVYSPLYGGYASRVEVVPAYNRGKAPYGTALSSQLRLMSSYVAKPSTASDVAVVKLRSPIGKTTGWLTTAAGIRAKETLTLSGYSSDLGGALGTSSGPITSVGAVALYPIDATVGASGSPLYDAAKRIKAVHGFEIGKQTNGGVPLTTSIRNTVLQWRNTSANVLSANKLVYVRYAKWNRYKDLGFAVLGTTAANQIFRIKQTAMAFNGEWYSALYNSAGKFQGWTNSADFSNVTTTAVNKTLTIRKAGSVRYGDFWLQKKLGTTNGYVNRSVFVTSRNVVGVNRAVYSLWTKRQGGTWLGYVDTSAVR